MTEGVFPGHNRMKQTASNGKHGHLNSNRDGMVTMTASKQTKTASAHNSIVSNIATQKLPIIASLNVLVFVFAFVFFAPSRHDAAYADTGGIHPGSYHMSPAGTSEAGTATDGFRYQAFDADVIRARAGSDERYAAIIDGARASVAPIVAMSDDDVCGLILPAETKRAFMVNRTGCPVHGGGTAVYLPFGQSIDLNHPHKVRCSIGGEWYPNDDFPDSGDGWIDERPGSPTYGQRFYFTGWFQHWFLKSIGDYLLTMARLWLITGEDVYRTKAMVLLERFAEVYPDIDSNDLTYSGTDWGVYVKMTGSYWEGSTLLNTAKAVEILYPALPPALIRTVHENIYRAAFDAYRAKPAAGNWGNNWNPALAKFSAVTGDREMIEYMMYDHPAAQMPVLDNQFFRDGFPYEASLSYASTYHNVASNVAEALGEGGGWIWEHPHMRESYRSFAEIVCLDRFTHFAADMGSPANTGWTLPTAGIERAWRAYRMPEIARYFMQSAAIYGIAGPRSLGDLFDESLDMDEVARAAATVPPLKSTVAPVRGIAILRRGAGDSRAELVFDYGYAHAAHHHADRLNINLFSLGREFIPEMGYPEYMDGQAPATGGWTTHTVCHATVEVDGHRQAPGVFGDLNAFAETGNVRYIDASCEDAYIHRNVGLYRRSLALVNIPGGWYVLDIFRVRGGSQHDYLFHGPAVPVELSGAQLGETREGTLAGTDVPFGEAPRGAGPRDLHNSGYQYLFDVREGTVEDAATAVWHMDDGVAFTARFLPVGRETLISTMGYPRPSTKSLPAMPFLLRRRTGPEGETASSFLTVLTAGTTTPVTKARTIALSGNSSPGAIGVAIEYNGGEDVVLSGLSPESRVETADGRFVLEGMFGVISLRNGKPSGGTIVCGSVLTTEGRSLKSVTAVFSTTVREVHEDHIVTAEPLPALASGDVILADRGGVRSVYKIGDIKGASVAISPSPWLGGGRVSTVDTARGIIVDDRRIFPLGDVSNGERNYYSGARITTPSGATHFRLRSGDNDGFVLEEGFDPSELKQAFPQGGRFLLFDIGPGDTITVIGSAEGQFR